MPDDSPFGIIPETVRAIGNVVKAVTESILAMFPGRLEASRARGQHKAALEASSSITDLVQAFSDAGLPRAESWALSVRTTEEAHGFKTLSAVLDQATKSVAGLLENGDISAEDTHCDAIDDAWRDEFSNGASKARDEEAQRMWARILAEELVEPGSYSRRALATLGKMDRVDAETFERFCSYGVRICDSTGSPIKSEPLLIVLSNDNDRHDWYNYGGLSITDLSDLESLGLIDRSLNRNVAIGATKSLALNLDHALTCIVQSADGKEHRISFDAILTRVGAELSRLCSDAIGKGELLLSSLQRLAESRGCEARFIRMERN